MDPALQEGDTFPTIVKSVAQSRVEEYAAVSDDYNPIHLDPDFAAKSQFGRTIAHGMMIAATFSEMMTLAFGQDWLKGGRLKIRFRGPVHLGDTVETYGQIKRVQRLGETTEVTCAVGVRRQTGDIAITGEATVTATGQIKGIGLQRPA